MKNARLPSQFVLSPGLLMVFSAFCFALMGILIKLLSRLPAFETAFIRSAVNLLCLMPWAMRKMSWTEWTRDPWALVGRGVCGALSLVTLFYAIHELPVAEAMMLNYCSPIYSLILARIFLGEKLGWKSLTFVLVAFLGVLMVLDVSFERSRESLVDVGIYPPLIGALGAVLAAGAYIFVKLATNRKYSPSYIVFTFALFATVVTGIPTLFQFVPPTLEEWGLGILCGIVATVAQTAMTKGYAGLPASIASPFQFLSVVFAAGLGWIFLGEIVGIATAFGGFLVGLGLVGAYHYRTDRRTRV